MNQKFSFTQEALPDRLYWFNKPPKSRTGNGLEIWTGEKTDFWQRTHYGFQRDDGHCLFRKVTGDFSITAKMEFNPATQYDQCGLMIRIDKDNWIKVSCEFENENISRLGSVVTNLGFSDWASQDIPSSHRMMYYRVSKRGTDFLAEASYDGDNWFQLRIAHLHALDKKVGGDEKNGIEAGLYTCSPIGENFYTRTHFLEFNDNKWTSH